MAESDRTAHLRNTLFFQQSNRLLGLSFPKDDAPTATDLRAVSYTHLTLPTKA
uniref:Uncharacterized protein n=1 Tax=Ralstonia solanacearum TaxID=305 RepID=A0A0S4XJC2_RALSL|nr:protein of unknown function [Ralstonia solanacearum]